MENTDTKIKNLWLLHLSEQDNVNLPSIMEDYFNDKLDFETLNAKITELDIVSFITFKKSIVIDDFL